MSETSVRSRSEIEPKYRWNATSVFCSDDAWQRAFDDLVARLDAFRQFQGHLGDSPETLTEAMALRQDLVRRAGQVAVYATMAHAVDMGNQAAAGMSSQARGLHGQVAAAMAFVDPELLAVGRTTLEQWMRDEPRLAYLAHYVEDLFRQQEHVRSAEVEELLGMLADPFSGASATVSMLTNADLRFEPAVAGDGREIPVTQGTLGKVLSGGDREARRTAWEHYADQYLAYKNTLASSLATSIKQCVLQMRARRHTSTLQASLFAHNIPIAVFEGVPEFE